MNGQRSDKGSRRADRDAVTDRDGSITRAGRAPDDPLDAGPSDAGPPGRR
jgi:hypothetical protein